MKNKKFFNLDHAANYLMEGVIRLRDVPIYIVGVDRGKHNKSFTLEYYEVGDDNRKLHTILSDNPDIDMNPVPLGLISHVANVDSKYNTAMVMRVQRRSYKVGLTTKNMALTESCSGMSCNFRSSLSSLILSKELKNTIIGSYPSFSKALAGAEKTGTVKAFSRRWATDGKALYYKSLGVPVGKIVREAGKIDENFFFLKEVYNEDIKHANY